MRDLLHNRWVGRALDALWLLALSVYIFAGMDAAPFHGDESTLLFMSHDYYFIVQQHDIDRVLYRDPPIEPSEQELRILNGTIPKMAMGLAWDLAGLTVQDLNDQWAWGFYDPAGEWDEWTWNHAFGHAPSEALLHAGRVSSSALLALSVALLFALVRLIVPGRLAAWAATLIYVTTPAVLLNGRRSMLEGALLFGVMLVALAAVMLARAQARPGARRASLTAWAAALGVAGGIALASKHTAGVVVAAAYLGVLLEPLVRRAVDSGVRFDLAHIGRLALASAIACGVFLVLNPAWWSEPLAMPGRVLEARQRLIEGQVEGYGSYEDASARVTGLLDQAFFAAPQYYEVAVWQEYIDDEIAAYEASWLAGRRGGAIWGALLVAAFAFGAATLVERWREGPALIVLLWAGVTALALLALTPLAWQRYYLPLQPAIAMIAGVGVWRLAAFAAAWARGAGLVRAGGRA